MVRLIAEIGCNHKGDMDIAKEMIGVAARICKADAVKFQKRNNRELLPPEQYDAPHPNPINSYGDTYGAHREALEFTPEQHQELMDTCASEGITYSTSVWDLTSAKEMAALKPDFLKIPSATNLHFGLQDWLCENYEGEIHVSTGMTTGDEVRRVVEYYEQRGRAKDVVLYACTSGYPVPFEDLSLLEVSRLKEEFGDRVKEIGFSGHHLGIAADIAAMTLGATTVERHFTLDRTWKGTDHAASLEPDGMRRLKRDLENVSKALTYKSKDILDIEDVQRVKLKWVDQSKSGQSVDA
jgi:N-acetylneuraminate synthase